MIKTFDKYGKDIIKDYNNKQFRKYIKFLHKVIDVIVNTRPIDEYDFANYYLKEYLEKQ